MVVGERLLFVVRGDCFYFFVVLFIVDELSYKYGLLADLVIEVYCLFDWY